MGYCGGGYGGYGNGGGCGFVLIVVLFILYCRSFLLGRWLLNHPELHSLFTKKPIYYLRWIGFLFVYVPALKNRSEGILSFNFSVKIQWALNQFGWGSFH